MGDGCGWRVEEVGVEVGAGRGLGGDESEARGEVRFTKDCKENLTVC